MCCLYTVFPIVVYFVKINHNSTYTRKKETARQTNMMLVSRFAKLRCRKDKKFFVALRPFNSVDLFWSLSLGSPFVFICENAEAIPMLV